MAKAKPTQTRTTAKFYTFKVKVWLWNTWQLEEVGA